MLSVLELLNIPPVFLDNWDNEEEVYASFETEPNPDYKILYANYGYEAYDGYASVIGFDYSTGKFFYNTGSHCSCYGLEGQWEPELMSIEEVNEFVERGHDAFVRWINH